MMHLRKSYGEKYTEELIFKGKIEGIQEERNENQKVKENSIKDSLKYLNETQVMEVFKISKSELDDIRKKYEIF